MAKEFDFKAQQPARRAAKCPDAATDSEGHTYRTVLIGEQCWFAENLAVSTSRSGARLPDTVVIDLNAYGRLYRYPHVTVEGGLCPAGWHVPTDNEFQTLERTLGLTDTQLASRAWRGDNKESLRLKKSATAFSWTEADTALVNQTGFSLEPAGEQIGFFTGADGVYAGLWTTTEYGGDMAFVRYFVWNATTDNNGKIWRDAVDKERAYSVRCLRDG